MDRRLAERRRRVAEERARSNLGRLVRVLLMLAVVASLVWFAQSPFLSVGEIVVRGQSRVDVAAVLQRHGVVEGRPMLVVDVGGAERALATDPWVASARVARDWPTRVVVELTERQPAVVAELSDGTWLVAADATLLETTDEAAAEAPRVVLPHLASQEAPEDLALAGAVEYLVSLPAQHRQGASVAVGEEGLEAQVSGYRVRLGQPFDGAEKAAVTAAMIDDGVEEGSVLTVVAPASPAVLPPGADQGGQGSESDTTPTTQP